MTFVAPESLSEQIAQYLAQRIIQGDMRPGERIQEVRVVNELQVSRGSVREALLILERRHLIEILPRRGAQVARLDGEKITALYDIYINLLVMLSTRVAVNWKEGNVKGLVIELERMHSQSAAGDDSAFIEACFGLMRAAFPIAANPYLTQLMEDLQPAIHRAYALAVRYQPQEAKRAAQFFSDLFNAAMRRDTEQIPAMLKAYGDHQCAIVLDALAREATACA